MNARHKQDRETLVAWLEDLGVKVFEHDRQWFLAREYRLLDDDDKTDFDVAPFTSFLGLVWKGFEIHCLPSTPWPHLLHEAGHLLACKVEPNSKEEGFLGWELVVAEHLKLSLKTWYHFNRDYGVNYRDADALVDIPFRSRRFHEFLGDIWRRSSDLGLVTNEDRSEPCILRRPPEK